MKNKSLLKDIIIDKRRKINTRISLRSTALKVGIPSGRLSEVLNEKRPLSDYYIDKLTSALKLSPEDVAVLRQVQLEQQAQGPQGNEYNTLFTPKQIEMSIDWKSFAIMSFFQTTTYTQLRSIHTTQSAQTLEIARLMKLDASELQKILETMTSIDQIRWQTDHWIATNDCLTTGYDIPTEYIRNAHAKDLELAKEKLQTVDVLKRDFSSMTISIDPDDVFRAKKLIRAFRRNFAETLEKKEKKAVYQISIQFFPIIDTELDN